MAARLAQRIKRSITPRWLPNRAERELLAWLLSSRREFKRRASAEVRALNDLAPHDRRRDLLAHVYYRLRQERLGALITPAIENAFIENWRRAEIRNEILTTITRACRAERIEIIALKGIALALTSYPHPALREMFDLDLMFRPADLPRVRTLFSRLNWQPEHANFAARTEMLHSTPFRQIRAEPPLPLEIDVHWLPLQELCREKTPADDRGQALRSAFWRRARRVTIGDSLALKVLDPTDQLLQLCAHARAWSLRPSPKWVLDIALLLKKHEPEIKWRRLRQDAATAGVGLAIRQAMQCVAELRRRDFSDAARRELTRIASPDATGAGLAGRRAVSRRSDEAFLERYEDWMSRTPIDPWAGSLLKRWTNYRRWRAGKDSPSFAQYLAHCWSDPTTPQGPLVRLAWSRAVARVRARWPRLAA